MCHPIETTIKLREHGLWADEFYTRGGQLEGEWQTIQPAADL